MVSDTNDIINYKQTNNDGLYALLQYKVLVEQLQIRVISDTVRLQKP
jgi:hypothetical protein